MRNVCTNYGASAVFGLTMIFAATLNAADFVNMSKLLSSGEEVDEKEIIVSGYICDVSDSANGLFLTLDDCRFSNYDNAIRLSNFKSAKTGDALVRVRGKFNSLNDVVKTDDPYIWGQLSVTMEY